MRKCLKIYQLNVIKKDKERLQKKASEWYQNLSKEEKVKKQQYGRNVTKISQKRENKSLFGIEKKIIEWEEML